VPKVVAYVPQDDRHAPTLTVSETVAFAFSCMSGKNSHALATLSVGEDIYDSLDSVNGKPKIAAKVRTKLRAYKC